MRTVRSSRSRGARDGHRAATALPAVLVSLVLMLTPTSAFAEHFDFDTAPIHSSLPLVLTVGAVTAHFSGGFSIQLANSMGFTPAGFAGLCIYPNSVFASDLDIAFDQAVTSFSIVYAPQELACDSSAIMRVTAWRDAILVGSALTTAPAPGTWPMGTLAFGSAFGFNHVVIHYDRRPGVSCDWGPIFMADNMDVTLATTGAPLAGPGAPRVTVQPNPAASLARICVELTRPGQLAVTIHDAAGRRLRTLVSEAASGPGLRMLEWDGRDDDGFPVGAGIYFCRVQSPTGTQVTQVVLRR